MDNTPISLQTRAATYAFSNEEKKRRTAALKNKDFYYGKHIQYIRSVNSDVDPVMVNLTGPILDKRASLLYSRPVVREYDGPAQSIKLIEDLYYDINIDKIMRQVDLLTETTGTTLVYVGLDDKGMIQLVPYDAADFTPVPRGIDNQELEALSIVSLFYDVKDTGGGKIQVNPVIKLQIWTDNYIYEQAQNVTIKQERNEMGFIPFVPFKSEDRPHQYIGFTNTYALRKLNEAVNQQLTNCGYMVKMQSATPLVLTGFQNGEGLSVHPGTAMTLPAGATASALQLNPKVLEAMELIRYLEEKMYQTSSIPKISVTGDVGGSTSGIELMIRWAPIMSVFKEKALKFQRYELDLANMILRVLKQPPLNSLNVNYPEEAVLPVDTSRENLLEDISLGIRTPVDEILKINPLLDEDGALAEILANKDTNKAILGGLDARPNSNDPNPSGNATG